jgi:hypothetical protein
MATVMERIDVAAVTTDEQEAATPTCLITIYDLVAAIQSVVGPEDDALVVAIVVHLLQSGRCTWRVVTAQVAAPLAVHSAPPGHGRWG